MAPPPEYDKEPKAPDKSATSIPSEDSKALYNLVNELQTISDSKSTNSSANAEVENNKHVETLDDGQLRALLDEAITYKCPKDREGKSSLFKELLEEVEQDEQDEQACEAAARLPGGRGRRGARGRRALPHSNSLQDLVAALAAEPAPRRARAPGQPGPPGHPPAPVSARAAHGGSLPSGVDTSFLLSEEPMRGVVGASSSGGAEYVATVRCVNPSPLAERRVSASDAHCPDTDALTRRSKPVFPMYTARATLEIGSGSVCSGRAVTTTTASNQVRTVPRPAPAPRGGYRHEGKRRVPRGPPDREPGLADAGHREPKERGFWDDGACIDKWYRGLEAYGAPLDRITRAASAANDHIYDRNDTHRPPGLNTYQIDSSNYSPIKVLPKTSIINATRLNLTPKNDQYIPLTVSDRNAFEATKYPAMDINRDYKLKMLDVKDVEEAMARKTYRERVGEDLVAPSQFSYNPKNIRSMSIGPSSPVKVNADKQNQNPGISKDRDKPGKDKHNHNTRNRNVRYANSNVITDKPVPADKNKPDPQSKTNQHNAGQIRSSSQHNRKKSNVNSNSIQNTIEKQSNKFDVKDQSKIDNVTPKKDTGLVEMVISKENSQNHAELELEMVVSEEKSQTDELKIKDNTELVQIVTIKDKSQNDVGLELQMVVTEERSRNNELKTKVDIELVDMVTIKDTPQNDADLVEMAVTEEKHREEGQETENDTKLVEMVSLQSSSRTENSNEFSLFMANQNRLLRAIESNNCNEEDLTNETVKTENPENIVRSGDQDMPNVEIQTENPLILTFESAPNPVPQVHVSCRDDKESEARGTEMVHTKKPVDFTPDNPQPAELPGDASYFLTLYKRFLTSSRNIDNTADIKPTGDAKPSGLDTAAKLPKKKKDKITSRLARKPHNENSNKKKDIIRNALKMLFFDNITQSDGTKSAGTPEAAATREVDSAIPFSCITTPEVVSSCTTTASAQAAVAVDPKPARSVAAAFNGVPLPRAAPACSAAAAHAHAAAEEFKKSLDENGNSVQGFSSPQSGSSQQKKQRRKKSSKNETVIKSHHIDGYQGNKDLNEVLRFIESNEPERPKRHDDKKKRSAERRKDKAQRASSLDDLSRAAPAPPRPARPALPAPKPERRSWGDERQAFYFRDPNPEPDPEPTDFQTVTKKRKPRRRADEPEPSARQRARAPTPPSPPSPRARSDRSADSNDDMDSVHSLPALPSRAAPPASYADIARAKHNIPDLIESCHYYGVPAPAPDARAPAPAPAPPAADGYPALERAREPRRPAKPAAPAARRAAPDVVADRRPPVILLDEAARPRDMDGVTFGFDVNEQLLGPPRCDLVPAAEPAGGGAGGAGGGAGAGGVAVRAGCAALRYVPPAPPPDDHHLHQIIDYVGAAWEDVVRCGVGKVRYFSD